MVQSQEATIVAQSIQREMPMHCDCCEVSKQLGLLAVAMYELSSTGERLGRVRFSSFSGLSPVAGSYTTMAAAPTPAQWQHVHAADLRAQTTAHTASVCR